MERKVTDQLKTWERKILESWSLNKTKKFIKFDFDWIKNVP